jgi:lactonase
MRALPEPYRSQVEEGALVGAKDAESIFYEERSAMMPLPSDLASLTIITAEPWCLVDSREDIILEGPAFARDGNLFLVAPTHGLIFKVTPERKVTTVFEDQRLITCGSAFHRDGRLFVGCLSGELLILDLQGGSICLCPTHQGNRLSINDLVFDQQGNLYVTDFAGNAVTPTGGVYRISCDGIIVEPVVRGLASPNGVSLSPEGNALWVGETTRNTVLRIAILEDGVTVNPIDGVVFAYYSTGCPGPDSNAVDSAGNLYQCIMGQGRAVVLDPSGIPVANVVVVGRDEGRLLGTANLAFKPGTDQGYLVASGAGGAWVCTFQAMATGLELFSHAEAKSL